MNTNRLLSVAVLALFALGSAACSGGSGDDEPRPDGGPGADAPDGGTLPDAPASETCVAADLAACTPAAATGDADGVLFKGTVIGASSLTCSGEVLVSRSTGKILCVGEDCASDPGAAGAAVVCGDVISPGIVDAHSHLNYNHLPRFRHEGTLYQQRSNWQGDDDYHNFVDANYDIRDALGCETMKWAEVRQILGGGTAALGSYGNACIDRLERNLDDAEASGLGEKVEYIIFVDRADEAELKTHVDSGGAAAIHLAEGVNQGSRENEWQDLTGADLLRPGVSLIHGTALAVSQLADLAVTPTSLIWSPRSNLDLYGLTSPVTAAKHLGLPLALGTDWTPSGSMNMLDELRCADTLNRRYYDHTFSDQELVGMATVSAARALLVDDHIGRLAVGLEADVTVFRGDRTRPYRAIIDAGVDDVALVMIAGRPTYGDDALLAGLALEPDAWCEDLDVCGRGRRICVRSEDATTAAKHHQTLADIQAALEGGLTSARTASGCTGEGCYMFELERLFACDPLPEDVCFPGTPDAPGTPSAGDGDGDGVDDAEDLCPRIFDPPFMGTSAQEDADGDGEGDACDLCPLTPEAVCPPPDTSDLDGDGAANEDDNCPRLANSDQADGDLDGVGDACDACPGVSTADCATIGAIRQPDAVGHPRPDSRVNIPGVVVTAIDSTAPKGRSVWVQDPASTTFAGLHLYFGTTALPAGLEVGDTVTVAGTYTEYFEESELESPTITVTSTTTTAPAPTVAAASALATGGAMAEALESMLVQVSGVAVVVANPDAPDADYDEVGLTAGLRMDDLILDGCDPNNPKPPTGCPANAPRTLPYGVGTTFTSITGILGFSFSERKLYPRTAADIVTP